MFLRFKILCFNPSSSVSSCPSPEQVELLNTVNKGEKYAKGRYFVSVYKERVSIKPNTLII